MTRITTLQKIQKVLFDDIEDIRGVKKGIGNVELTPAEERKLIQYRAAFTFWLEKPELSDKKIVDFLKTHFDISPSPAYEIVFALKSILGNVRNADKEWNRYTVIEMAKKAYALAESQEDYKGMVMAATTIGKFTKLDKPDDNDVPWSEMIPPSFEPSYDIAILDPKLKIENLTEKRKQLREKYKGNIEVQDAEIIE